MVSSFYICAFSMWPEGVVIILAVVLLFGGKKIPELMKGLGQGMKEFKNARNESGNDTKKDDIKE